MCLLHAIQSRWQEHNKNISSLHIMTCDHNTRENIKKEIDLVEHASIGSTFISFQYTWNDYSEQALRERRHKQFIDYCTTHHISLLLTWHHLDDRIETTLLNMKRGTGLKGISSISISDPHFLDNNITIVRPLITSNKKEIIQYCKKHTIEYVVDPTNQDIHYSERNAIRKIIQKDLWTQQFYNSRQLLYESLTETSKKNRFKEVEIIQGKDSDLIAITSQQRTPDILYHFYQKNKISINPRSSTLQTLCDQLNKKSGSKISYQWLSITAYQYGSIIKKL